MLNVKCQMDHARRFYSSTSSLERFCERWVKWYRFIQILPLQEFMLWMMRSFHGDDVYPRGSVCEMFRCSDLNTGNGDIINC